MEGGLSARVSAEKGASKGKEKFSFKEKEEMEEGLSRRVHVAKDPGITPAPVHLFCAHLQLPGKLANSDLLDL